MLCNNYVILRIKQVKIWHKAQLRLLPNLKPLIQLPYHVHIFGLLAYWLHPSLSLWPASLDCRPLCLRNQCYVLLHGSETQPNFTTLLLTSFRTVF